MLAYFVLVSSLVKGFAVALALLSSTVALCAPSSISDAFVSDATGIGVTNKLGDSFYITTNFSLSGLSNFHLSIDTPFQHLQTGELTGSGAGTITWGQLQSLSADALPVTISLVAGGSVAATRTILVRPTLPSVGLEFYEGRALQGSVSAQVSLARGNSASLEWWLPRPVASPSQSLTFLSNPAGAQAKTTAIAEQPVTIVKGGLQPQMQFGIKAFSTRTNPALLQGVQASELRRLPTAVLPWLKAETLVDPNSPLVKSFVNASLVGVNRSTARPYDVAKNLFRSTVARLNFDAAETNPSVTRALQSNRGDCGSFAAVFVASCRNVGIPAREVVGMVAGENQWHVWAEFYLPRFGWIPCDPSYANGVDPDGAQASYFGVLPDGNQRAILTYGFDHIVGGKKVSILQSPALFLNGATLQALNTFCSLREELGQ